MKQKYSSANTSINSKRRPRIYKAAADMIKGRVIDYGCGKFFDSYDFSDIDAVICGYDKYNRPDVEALNASYDVAICSNVLNVIAEADIRADVARELRKLAPVAIITIYEGIPGKQPGPTKDDCWQENRKADDYIPELETVFGAGHVTYRNGYIICTR